TNPDGDVERRPPRVSSLSVRVPTSDVVLVNATAAPLARADNACPVWRTINTTGLASRALLEVRHVLSTLSLSRLSIRQRAFDQVRKAKCGCEALDDAGE